MSINVTRSSMPDFEEYCREIRGLWDSHWLTNMGEKHIEFERKLREYLGVDFLNLFTNGHLALEELIASFGFPKGGEVITTPFTFVSTTHAIVRNGLTPVFCDIDPEDYTIDDRKIEELITERTVAILPVHVYGNLCHVDEIRKIAERHAGNASAFARSAGIPEEQYNGDIRVIYDAAHTFGVRRKEQTASPELSLSSRKPEGMRGTEDANGSEGFIWRSACDYGDAAILSFHATKVFNTIEGGAAISHDEKRTEVLDDLKNFGIRNPELCAYVGGNAKMSEFQAAMGICNLRHVDAEIEKRKAVFGRYLEQLGETENIRLWRPQPDVLPNYAYLPAMFEEIPESGTRPSSGKSLRDRVWEALKEEGITARKYFWPLTSDLKCYEYLHKGADSGSTPVARRIASGILTLPIYADLSMEDVDRICGIIRKTL